MTWNWLDFFAGTISGYFAWFFLSSSALKRISKDRDEWKRMCIRHEELNRSQQVTMEKFKALACGHEPGDPYTTLTPEREIQLHRDRIAEIHQQQAMAEEHD